MQRDLPPLSPHVAAHEDGVIDIPAGEEAMSFAYWSWNPNSSYTGGILQDDWTHVHQHKLAAIEPLLIG